MGALALGASLPWSAGCSGARPRRDVGTISCVVDVAIGKEKSLARCLFRSHPSLELHRHGRRSGRELRRSGGPGPTGGTGAGPRVVYGRARRHGRELDHLEIDLASNTSSLPAGAWRSSKRRARRKARLLSSDISPFSYERSSTG